MNNILAVVGVNDAYQTLSMNIKKTIPNDNSSHFIGISLLDNDNNNKNDDNVLLHEFKEEVKNDKASTNNSEKNILVRKSTNGLKTFLNNNDNDNTSNLYNIGISYLLFPGKTKLPSNLDTMQPFLTKDKKLSIIGRGKIINYRKLRERIEKSGVIFQTNEDIELFVHLFNGLRDIDKDSTISQLLNRVFSEIQGNFTVFILSTFDKKPLVVGVRGSSLSIGILKNSGYVLSTDIAILMQFTSKVVHVDSWESVRIIEFDNNSKYIIKNHKGEKKVGFSRKITVNSEELGAYLDAQKKGKFKRFMAMEMHNQPSALRDCLAGRILKNIENNKVSFDIKIESLKHLNGHLKKTKRILIVGSGTSWHAALLAETYFEDFLRIPTETTRSSEFITRKPILQEGDLMFCLSQSGNTGDTCNALRLVNEEIPTISVCNEVNSVLCKESAGHVLIRAGTEMSVAATKSFINTIVTCANIALYMAQILGTLNNEQIMKKLKKISSLPSLLENTIKYCNKSIPDITKVFRYSKNFLVLGRGYNFPIALQGALKLMECAYVHAEGYPAAEMKHGPIALIDIFMPIIFIAPKSDPTYNKIVSNIEEVVARKGSVIAITDEGNDSLDNLCNYVLKIPEVDDWLVPILTVIPMQMFAYQMGLARDCPIDEPRGLSKVLK